MTGAAHLRAGDRARYGRGVSRPTIGQLAPRFELPVHGVGDTPGESEATWSLDEHVGGRRAVVLIFHRHIH